MVKYTHILTHNMSTTTNEQKQETTKYSACSTKRSSTTQGNFQKVISYRCSVRFLRKQETYPKLMGRTTSPPNIVLNYLVI